MSRLKVQKSVFCELLKTEVFSVQVKLERQTRLAVVQHQVKNEQNCVLEETKICCHHFTWVRSRIREN